MLRHLDILIACSAVCASALAASDIRPARELHWPWESRYHALSMSPPPYPYEARRLRLTTTGVIAVEIDTKTDLVTSASMRKTTGSEVLDQACLAITKKWRFQPEGSQHLNIPVSFSIAGVTLG